MKCLGACHLLWWSGSSLLGFHWAGPGLMWWLHFWSRGLSSCEGGSTPLLECDLNNSKEYYSEFRRPALDPVHEVARSSSAGLEVCAFSRSAHLGAPPGPGICPSPSENGAVIVKALLLKVETCLGKCFPFP